MPIPNPENREGAEKWVQPPGSPEGEKNIEKAGAVPAESNPATGAPDTVANHETLKEPPAESQGVEGTEGVAELMKGKSIPELLDELQKRVKQATSGSAADVENLAREAHQERMKQNGQ